MWKARPAASRCSIIRRRSAAVPWSGPTDEHRRIRPPRPRHALEPVQAHAHGPLPRFWTRIDLGRAVAVAFDGNLYVRLHVRLSRTIAGQGWPAFLRLVAVERLWPLARDQRGALGIDD